jgi:hypothetical protein
MKKKYNEGIEHYDQIIFYYDLSEIDICYKKQLNFLGMLPYIYRAYVLFSLGLHKVKKIFYNITVKIILKKFIIRNL